MKKIFFLFFVLLSHAIVAQKINYDSLSLLRKQLEGRIYESRKNGNNQQVISYLKMLADTDKDTLLVAAKAYGRMSGEFSLSDDSVLAALAEEKQLNLLEQSLKKYPDNMQVYIDRLSFYKFADDKTGEQEFIKLCDQKFGDQWEMNFELAYHFVLYDFLWKETKDYDVALRYLKKANELNPQDFNTLFLLETSQTDPIVQQSYLDKMYVLKPKLFTQTVDPSRKAKYPYQIKTKLQGKDLTTFLTKKQCQTLKLIP